MISCQPETACVGSADALLLRCCTLLDAGRPAGWFVFAPTRVADNGVVYCARRAGTRARHARVFDLCRAEEKRKVKTQRKLISYNRFKKSFKKTPLPDTSQGNLLMPQSGFLL